MKPHPATHWTRTDTILTALATIAALAGLIGAAAGWNFGPL